MGPTQSVGQEDGGAVQFKVDLLLTIEFPTISRFLAKLTRSRLQLTLAKVVLVGVNMDISPMPRA